jgi:ABC-2 type transport system ATP-binding protein
LNVIEVENLLKKFNGFTAVDDVSFSVGQGEMFGFVGPNGAGKSTTIKILCTLLKPSGGRATLAGHDVVKEPTEVRRAIGIVFQDPSLDDRLTAEENLRFHGMLYHVPVPVLEERMQKVLDIVDLADRRDALVRTFSGGMKRRLEIARGLLHYPQVLFLDEPTIGLDPQSRNAIWEHISRLREEIGITVFMTTHYMEEAENCDRIAVIDHGRIQAIDTPSALKRGLGGDMISLSGDEQLKTDLAARYGVEVQEVNGKFHFPMTDGAAFVPKLMSDFPNRIRSIQVAEPSLDDVFLRLTGTAIRDTEADSKDQMRRHMMMHRGRR